MEVDESGNALRAFFSIQTRSFSSQIDSLLSTCLTPSSETLQKEKISPARHLKSRNLTCWTPSVRSDYKTLIPAAEKTDLERWVTDSCGEFSSSWRLWMEKEPEQWGRTGCRKETNFSHHLVFPLRSAVERRRMCVRSHQVYLSTAPVSHVCHNITTTLCFSSMDKIKPCKKPFFSHSYSEL